MTTRREALKTMAGAAMVPVLGSAAVAKPIAPAAEDMETRAARWVVEKLSQWYQPANGDAWDAATEKTTGQLAAIIRGLGDEPHRIPVIRKGEAYIGAWIVIRRFPTQATVSVVWPNDPEFHRMVQ